MQPNLAAAFVLFALVLFAILRWSVALPIAETGAPSAWPGTSEKREPGEASDVQQPETDRAPRRLWPIGLSAAVAVTAAVRVALLVTLRA